MTYFYVGDVPNDVLVVSPELNGAPLDTHEHDVAEILLIDPSGNEITTLTGDISGHLVEVTFPATSVFTEVGVYLLIVIIDHSGHEGGIAQADPVEIVADDSESEWATLANARSTWIDSRAVDDAVLYELLQVARSQVIEYAPVLGETDPVPLAYRQAQILQARNIYNATIVDAGTGDIGTDTFTIRPFPLDWQVKQLLRPRRGVPVVG